MKIIVYPVGENPYQNLLFNELKKHKKVKVNYLRNEFIDVKHGFTIGMPLFPFRLIYHRLKGWKVIHLHWLSPFVIPIKNNYIRYFSSLYILSFLIILKLLRFKLVWTLHEIMPHEKEFHNDKSIRSIISKFSDAKIFHTKSALQEAKILGFDTTNSVIIPHGNFKNSYKNKISRKKARKILNINNDTFVFLFFGLIKSYKGIDTLLITFEKLLKNNKNVKLIIAGKCVDIELKTLVTNYKNKYPSYIDTYLYHIRDDEVELFFNATNIVTLPFKRNTTSGSAILAMSFGKPIIAPLLGNMKDLPQNVGFFYNPQNTNGLFFNMLKALQTKHLLLNSMGYSGLEYMKRLSWTSIAGQTKNTFNKVVT